MSTSIHIDPYCHRHFCRTDLDALVAIEEHAGDACWDRRTLASFGRTARRHLRVIVTNGNRALPIGFYAFEHRNRDLYIANIAVAKHWRRKRVASFALKSLEHKARRLGCQQIALDVQEENLAAQLLYKNAGYKAVEISRNHYGEQDGYHMIKVLRSS